MRFSLVIVGAALALAACTTDTPSPATTAPPESSTSTVAPMTPPCLAGDIPFTSEGTVALFGEADGDAAVIGGVRWAEYDGCERLVVDLLTGDASPGSIVGEGAAVFVSDHIVRIELPAAVIDTDVGQFSTRGLAGSGYVVHADDGGFFIDLHLEAPAEVRVFDLDAPARVVVDLRQGTGTLDAEGAPRVGGDVVISTWTDETPRAVAGYATTDEVVVGSGESFATVAVASFPGSWGAFSATVPGDGPIDVATSAGEGVTLP